MYTLGKSRTTPAVGWPGIEASIKFGVVGALALALYARVISGMVVDWLNDPGASHGLLIPPLAGMLAWLQRKRTLAIPASADSRGLIAVAGGCLLLLAAELGAEFFIARLSLVLLMVGLIWTFWGLPRLKTLTLPLLVFVTMVPLPAIIYSRLAVPLQLGASRLSAMVLEWMGLTVSLDGNIISLPNITLGVAEACSGLRALPSFLVVSLIIGFLQCRKVWLRIVLAIMAVITAIAINIVRIVGTALLSSKDEHYALGFYHSFTSWLMLVIGMGLFWIVATWMQSRWDSSTEI